MLHFSRICVSDMRHFEMTFSKYQMPDSRCQKPNTRYCMQNVATVCHKYTTQFRQIRKGE